MPMYDAVENSRRLKLGLIALVSGSPVAFSSNKLTSFIVVFDGAPSLFSGGRIALFQQYILSTFGKIPEIVREVPSCIKVFFYLPWDDQIEKERLMSILSHIDFTDLCRKLEITYVQFGGKIYFQKGSD